MTLSAQQPDTDSFWTLAQKIAGDSCISPEKTPQLVDADKTPRKRAEVLCKTADFPDQAPLIAMQLTISAIRTDPDYIPAHIQLIRLLLKDYAEKFQDSPENRLHLLETQNLIKKRQDWMKGASDTDKAEWLKSVEDFIDNTENLIKETPRKSIFSSRIIAASFLISTTFATCAADHAKASPPEKNPFYQIIPEKPLPAPQAPKTYAPNTRHGKFLNMLNNAQVLPMTEKTSRCAAIFQKSTMNSGYEFIVPVSVFQEMTIPEITDAFKVLKERLKKTNHFISFEWVANCTEQDDTIGLPVENSSSAASYIKEATENENPEKTEDIRLDNQGTLHYDLHL